MSRCIAVLFWALLSLLSSEPAHAFIDPPWVEPASPHSGDAVSLNIHLGICDAIFDTAGYPQITRQGNAIRILLNGAHYDEGSELCTFGVGTVAYSIGSYESGDYTLQVDLRYDHVPIGPEVMTIGVVAFSVVPREAAPAQVPLDKVGILLIFALAALGIWTLRGAQLRRASVVVSLLLACCGAEAANRNVVVLLKTGSGVPTPTQVMTWANASPRIGPPPLSAFSTKAPQGGQFLIPDRATGDFLAWLQSNPNSVRYKLEYSMIMTYATALDIPAALTSLHSDPNVAEAYEPISMDFSSMELQDFGIEPEVPPGGGQYGWADLNLAEAWEIAGGYGFVAMIDMGLDVDHPALAQFAGSTYIGGNFMKSASVDVGLTGQPAQTGFDPTDVDEGKSQWIDAGTCTPTRALLPPDRLGHGTHATGLLAANQDAALGVQGTCRHCGIAMWKSSYLTCVSQFAEVDPIFNSLASQRAEAQAVDNGAQLLNMSFGGAVNTYNYCGTNRNHAECLVLAYALSRETAMVSSSGNERLEINFPAMDSRVISAGGFQQDLALWDDSPGGTSNCPPAPGHQECGSNYSLWHGSAYFSHQELLGSAKSVLSTTYPNTTWVDYAECGDGYGTPMGDGIGWCTGTSMSAPQISGVVMLLRSINPLLTTSVPEPAVGAKQGLRSVLAQTASQAQAALPWDPRVGYGIPDAAAAAAKLIGKVAGARVKNRATPLFRLYNSFTKDFAETTSVESALSLMITQVHNYIEPSTGLGAEALVPGFTFPYDPDDPASPDDAYESAPAAPRAAIYVMTTEFEPRSEWPALTPIYLMEKPKTGGHDYLLATPTDMQTIHATGYNLLAIQGYIYQPCMPEPACVPPGAERIYRACSSTNGDCATFLEHEGSAFISGGYPMAKWSLLGYAYSSTDTDSDGLPDGFEYVVGTSPTRPDSDGDGTNDAVEFPLSGLPVSDPCAGGTGALYCPADVIFKNAFDPI